MREKIFMPPAIILRLRRSFAAAFVALGRNWC